MIGTRFTKITFAVTLILLFGGIAFTQYFVNLHRSTEYDLAQRWFTRGGEAMQAGLPGVAADDYRTALSYDPENSDYRLRLAEALLADNRLVEAGAHLNSLWEEEPANGGINLDLARLYVRKGRLNEAVRYYRNAINGVWPEQARKNRIAVRFELARYLMQQQKWAQAQAEVMALLADSPTQPDAELQLGELLLQVNEPEHAIEAFNSVLAKEHDNAEAWLGKGDALLAMSKYADAEHAFASAVQYNSSLNPAREQLSLVRELLRIAPNLRGLSLAERTQRVADAFNAALNRLVDCAAQKGQSLIGLGGLTSLSTAPAHQAPSLSSGIITASPASTAAPNDLQLLYSSGLQKQPSATERALKKNPDALEPTMQYVFEVERTAAATCPSMNDTDRALLTLAQHEAETLK